MGCDKDCNNNSSKAYNFSNSMDGTDTNCGSKDTDCNDVIHDGDCDGCHEHNQK